MGEQDSCLVYLSPVGIGIKAVVTNHHLTLIGNMGGHSGNKLQVIHRLCLSTVLQLPKADLILITHEHVDHLDPTVIEILCKEDSDIVLTEKCLAKFKGGMVMKNGETKTIKDIMIEAIPAYNIKHMRSPNNPFHPRGDGNGYILTLADKKIYVAGDTENTPEMKALKDIDIAFLPMNLPYTMTPEMVADAARAFMPKILYPYHFGKTNPQALVELLSDVKERVLPLF